MERRMVLYLACALGKAMMAGGILGVAAMLGVFIGGVALPGWTLGLIAAACLAAAGYALIKRFCV